MLIPTYYLLSKIWDIFATRRRILLEINKNYFRGGEVIYRELSDRNRAAHTGCTIYFSCWYPCTMIL